MATVWARQKDYFFYQNALAYLVVGEDLEVAGPVVGAEELVKPNALLLSMFENFFSSSLTMEANKLERLSASSIFRMDQYLRARSEPTQVERRAKVG